MREENDQLSVTWDQSLDRFYMALRTFYIIYVALLNECAENFGIPTKEDLAQFDTIP